MSGLLGWLRGHGRHPAREPDAAPAAPPPAPAAFVPVARADELPPGARKLVRVAGHAVLVLNIDGTLYAVPNACPHRGWPLSEAREAAGVLKCARHGWEFDVPSGRSTWPPFGYRLRHLPLRVADGMVEVAWVEPEIELAH
ncbi:MAG TPA: Rieske (2Fe-2S) protein [Chloroflexota bacterium]|nr:Rieske (2Fe-2S) protein [Chloroflexota bacterium]